ncbi:copper amine oxidase N-terminal domain-containing protein [Xylanibacillus composti]|uniref:Copper amine oxidase-like N-terminal domain-containing protein n=1 Tax=Xylanibacillus composti TaxID=1572762 RepID=A0A8J4H5J3_9BACL|nr:copper amine oxidase N-terminal domain-containing protein [Xylanibacillus composti]MDT9726875.1 copper amine oxidase N-terminal domain-containing protein [Xylanibacillus composti]GIQ71353.1 hypothetical protein XYCOK13_41770 [Xylanibacillus composti]
MLRKALGWTLIAAMLQLAIVPNMFGAAAANVETEDCYKRAHEERMPRPTGYIGANGTFETYDYSHLPDPQDLIFVCINHTFLPTDVPVEVENGSSLIPMRALVEALGGDVMWEEATNTVTVELDGNVLKLIVNDPVAMVNGNAVSMTVPARKMQGRVYIPLRFVSDQLGRSVLWQPQNRIIKVYGYPEISGQFVHMQANNSTDDYNYGNFFSTSRRYLLEQNGDVHVLEQYGGELHIKIFSSSFVKQGERKLPNELPLFGGAHAGEDGNFYVVYAQTNLEESNTLPVYRIVKYDKDWNKLDHADIQDVHVTKPLNASNLTMDSHNGKLVVYTGRERYLADDGLNHQSNIPIHIRMEDMAVLYKGGQWPRNHVSHSFATYVRMDGDRIVYADHGDAYPRSIVLQVEESERMTKEIDLIKFPGEIGDNYTGAHLGGLEVAENHYLVVGSHMAPEYLYRPGGSKNVFLASVPKGAENTSDVQITYLTNHSASSDVSVTETHLVKVNDNRFVVLWRESGGGHHVYYTVIDGTGKAAGEPKKLDGIPSPGHLTPLVLGDTLVWYHYDPYYSKEDGVEFYTLVLE